MKVSPQIFLASIVIASWAHAKSCPPHFNSGDSLGHETDAFYVEEETGAIDFDEHEFSQ